MEVASLENHLPPAGWAWLYDALRRYPVKSTWLYEMVNKGQVRARKRGVRWQIELASLEEALKAQEIPAGWLTTEQAGECLGVTAKEVQRRIRAGQLRTRWHGRRLLVEEASLEEIIVPPGWITTREAARRTGKAISTIRLWIREGKLRARKVGGRWVVAIGVFSEHSS